MQADLPFDSPDRPPGTDDTAGVDSSSKGDAARHLDARALAAGFDALPPAPRDQGRVRLIVRRGPGGRREQLARVVLDVDQGLPGDAWGRGFRRKVENQVTAIQHDLARMIANGQPLGLFGDNLFVDLDLSDDNLPPGSRLRIGSALVEVTPKPHNGCRKFKNRFGADALAFVQAPKTRPQNRRGVHWRVVETGDVAEGDEIRVLTRG